LYQSIHKIYQDLRHLEGTGWSNIHSSF